MQTAVEWLISVLAHNDILDHKVLSSNDRLYNLYKRLVKQAKEMEHNQRGYTKEDVLKAGEIGEINHHDYKHIVKLLDEARAINETYGSKGSDSTLNISLNSTLNSSSQTEISDEEIEKEAELSFGGNDRNKSVWVNACKWYREQLKNKQ